MGESRPYNGLQLNGIASNSHEQLMMMSYDSLAVLACSTIDLVINFLKYNNSSWKLLDYMLYNVVCTEVSSTQTISIYWYLLQCYLSFLLLFNIFYLLFCRFQRTFRQSHFGRCSRICSPKFFALLTWMRQKFLLSPRNSHALSRGTRSTCK